MVTIYCKLVAKEHDFGGYTTYVFQNLENESIYDKYLMCTRWPNWEHRNLDLGETGYLTYKEVVAGVDTWYDGTSFIPYNYTNIIFIKFVKKADNYDQDIYI